MCGNRRAPSGAGGREFLTDLPFATGSGTALTVRRPEFVGMRKWQVGFGRFLIFTLPEHLVDDQRKRLTKRDHVLAWERPIAGS